MRLPDPGSHPAEQIDDQDEHVALRMTWFILVGWWLSALWAICAWGCLLLGVTMPLGLRMCGRIHHVATLKPPSDDCLDMVDITIWRMQQATPQRSALMRLAYALAIGWWASLVWTFMAWSQCLRLHNGTLAVTMLLRLPVVMTLRRV